MVVNDPVAAVADRCHRRSGSGIDMVVVDPMPAVAGGGRHQSSSPKNYRFIIVWIIYTMLVPLCFTCLQMEFAALDDVERVHLRTFIREQEKVIVSNLVFVFVVLQ
jgi:hypothetical protein